MINTNNRVDVKIVMLGDHTVGKTSLVSRYINDTFDEARDLPTIGGAFVSKEVYTNGIKKVFGIWDTAGTERYRAMARTFYRGARAAIICYNLTDKNSWEGLKSWIAELREIETNCQIYICGTKKDLIDDDFADRDVPEEKSLEYARGIQVRIFDTSSKTGENVGEMFQAIFNDCCTPEDHVTKNCSVVNLNQDKRYYNMCCQLS